MTFSDAAIRAARIAQQLGWTPDTFWSATPADLRHALGPQVAADSLDAHALAALMKEFPDGIR